jgi:excisionase family DNA binding protein
VPPDTRYVNNPFYPVSGCAMNDRALYSVTEARELLGRISRNSIYALLRSGELASVVLGCRRFISREAITELIAKSTTTTSPAIDPTRSRKPDQNLLPLPLTPVARPGRRKGNGK